MKNNNYPNWLVPLDIAKELKEIGFEEECHFFWNFYEDVNKMCCYADISEDDDDFLLPNTYNYNNKNSTGYYVYLSLPTWEQVFEWFREKGYHGVIAVGDESGELNEYSYCIDYLNELSSDFEQDSHLTYEEAREALVKALIRTYKNEQL